MQTHTSKMKLYVYQRTTKYIDRYETFNVITLKEEI